MEEVKNPGEYPDEQKNSEVEKTTFRNFSGQLDMLLAAALRAKLGLKPYTKDIDTVYEVSYLEAQLKSLLGE